MSWDDYTAKHGLRNLVCHCGKDLPTQRRAPHGGGRTRLHCSPECNKLANHCERTYGITVETYYEHVRKGCPICGAMVSMGGKRKRPIDHDHKTGKFRGVPCSNCNTGLGMFQDNIAFILKAAEYLQGA
jgi:hypothetical protein